MQALRSALHHRALIPFAPFIEPLVGDGAPTLEAIDRVLGPPAGVRFAAQPPRRRRGEPFEAARSYDGSIADAGVVPTRPGSLHDLMNAVAWAAFPRSKRAIHRLQAAALRAEVADGSTTLPGRRSRLRDRLSMLDEGGVIVGGEASLDGALARADTAAIEELRDAGAFSVWVLGHAITEHVVRAPQLLVRGCVVRVEGTDPDAALSARLSTLGPEALTAWIGALPSLPVAALLR